MPAAESTPSAQEQLDRLSRDRDALGKRHVLPTWWYVAWGVALATVPTSGYLIEYSTIASLTTAGSGLGLMLLLEWPRRRLQGVRIPWTLRRPRPGVLALEVVVVLAGLVLCIYAAFWLVHSTWPLALFNAAVVVFGVLNAWRGDRLAASAMQKSL